MFGHNSLTVSLVASVIVASRVETTATDYPCVSWHWIRKNRRVLWIWCLYVAECQWQKRTLTLVNRELDDLHHLPAKRELDGLAFVVLGMFQGTVNSKVRWHLVQLTSLVVVTVTFVASDR